MPHVFESAPIEVERFYTGVISQRNRLAIPIRIFGRRLIELYDAILSGQNAELTIRSTLQRAAGFIQYNTNTVSGIPQKFYGFQQVSSGTIFPIVDTTTGVYYVPPGSAAPTTLITKTQGKQSSFFGLGNYLYIGNSEFSKKWDTGSPQGLTDWGIFIGGINLAVGPNPAGSGTDVAAPSSSSVWANPGNITAQDAVYATTTLAPGGAATSQGPLGAGTGVDAGGGGEIWASPGNITAEDGFFASTSIVSGGDFTDKLVGSNFGFSIPPNATITGILAEIKRKVSGLGPSDNGVFLTKAGSQVGTDHSGVAWTTALSFASYGSSSDLWGTTWTASDINNSGFGLQMAAINNGGVTRTASVDFYRITIYYTTPSGGALVSDLLEGTSFAFSIPASNTVTGVLVEVKGFQTQNASTSLSAMLLKAGTPIGTSKNMALPGANGFISYGGTGDLWGATLVPNDINQTTFGVALQAMSNYSGSTSWSVDFVRITIYTLGGPGVTVNAGAGSFSATQGYQYLFCYGNSNDGNISNPTPASLSSGVFTNKLNVQVSLTASTNAQVNQIRVFRTTDTGTGAVFFELPTSPYPNTTQTVNDTAADTALQVTQAVLVGTLAFSPPPAGLVNIEWYAGRLWGSVGNLLYFSAGPDNFPIGKGTSNWPPGNVFELPTQIVKNVALNGGNGMLVVTLDGIHIVQGISNPGFTVNKWLSDVGARQQNAVDTDGSNIFIFTSDRQFLRISAQGIEELSQYISDQTDLLDPTLVYVCQHRSGSQDSRVFLTNGSSNIYPYNLMMGAWEPVRTPLDGGGVGAISSIEISPGIWKLLKGANGAGKLVLQRDQATFSDNGTPYGWNVVFGNIPIADPTQLANVESLVLRFSQTGSSPTVGILPNDISGTFILLGPPKDEPPEGQQPPVNHRAKKYYFNTGAGLWTQMTNLQIQFTFPAEPLQSEIFSWGIFPNQSTDQQVGAIPQIQGR